MRGISRTIILMLLLSTSGFGQNHQLKLFTDKARYNPGDEVILTIDSNMAKKAKISIYHLDEVISEEKIKLSKHHLTEFKWRTPDKDYQGYLIHVRIGKDVQRSIAVDVSSDWGKYIRYGFLSKYPVMKAKEMDAVLAKLNRFHINGLQFYDYHNMHQKPVKLENNQPAESWPDIAGRLNYSKTVKYYIQKSGQLNMKSMAYNLIYGSWERGFDEDVKRQWLLYKDKELTQPNKLDFPDSWEDDICYMDSGNEAWQDYLIENTKPIRDVLGFDGWHVDQIGDIRPVYNSKGVDVKLDSTFKPFLQKAKEKLDMPIVMNAVNQYAQEYIASSGAVDFLYTEVWNPHVTFEDLVNVIKTNDELGKHQLSTVLAAYMNYDLANEKGDFNTPGILLADAVIFASGGVHLELGEHMLVHEYFPNSNRRISSELEENLIRYYDFLTAYENLLRDSDDEESSISCENVPFSSKPEKGKIWISQRKVGDYTIYHLVNFTGVIDMNWRDPKGTCPAPKLMTNIELKQNRKGDTFWASPDQEDIRLLPLPNKDGKVTVPSLKYWTMIVVKEK